MDKDEGARGIFRSLHDKLLTLPDTTEIWPGYLGGSLCGGPGMDLKVALTIGFERAHQDLLQLVDEDEFVRRATSTLGPQPPNFRNIVALNRGPLVKKKVDVHPTRRGETTSRYRCRVRSPGSWIRRAGGTGAGREVRFGSECTGSALGPGASSS